MPQMKPMNWLILFIMFLMLFFFFFIINFFNFFIELNIKMKNKIQNNKKIKNFWKW